MKLAARINLIVGSLVLAGIAGISGLHYRQIFDAETERARVAHRIASVDVERVLAMHEAFLEAQGRALAYSPVLRALLSTPEIDTETIQDSLGSITEGVDLDELVLVDTAGRVLAHRTDPASAGRPIAGVVDIQQVLKGRSIGGIWLGAGTVSLAVAQPVQLGNEVRGALVMARHLDVLFRDMHDLLQVHVAVGRGEKILASSWPAAPASVESLIGAVRREAVIDPWEAPEMRSIVAREGIRYHVARREQPLRRVLDGPDAPLDWWLIADLSALDRRLGHFSRSLGTGAVVLLGTLFLVLGGMTRRVIVRPIHAMVECFQRIGEGDFSRGVEVGSADEMGSMAAMLNQALGQLDSARRTEERRREEEREEQRKELEALGKIELAEVYMSQREYLKALECLGEINEEMVNKMPRSRYLKIQGLIRVQDEVRLESELRARRLTDFPVGTLRGMVKDLEEIGRHDLSMMCIEALMSTDSRDPMIPDLLRQVKRKLEESGEGTVLMQMIRKVLGEDFAEVRFLQAGGMGSVVTAHWRSRDRKVAVKFLPPAYASLPELRRRLAREVRSMMLLDHPNVVKILEKVEGESLGYIMEFIEGQDLERYMRHHRRLEPDEVVDIGVQMMRGLHHAHERGVIHRDVKPANFLRQPDGRIKLVDFGIARMSDATNLTRTGVSMGTPAYMSPEQIQGSQEVDEKSDLYSVGIILHEMLAGAHPFEGKMDGAERSTVPPEPLVSKRPGIPPDLSKLLEAMLVPDRRQRVIDCPEVLRILERLAGQRE